MERKPQLNLAIAWPPILPKYSIVEFLLGWYASFPRKIAMGESIDRNASSSTDEHLRWHVTAKAIDRLHIKETKGQKAKEPVIN